MTASPQVLAAFEVWKLAELASHYATPCPDEVMDALAAREHEAFLALMAAPAASAEDGLLKVFPLLLLDYQPSRGEPPMLPGKAKSWNHEPGFLEKLAEDLANASAILRAAMAAPHRDHV